MMKLSISCESKAKPTPLTKIDERMRRPNAGGRCSTALFVLVATLGLIARVQPAAALTLPENIPDFSQDTSRPSVRSVAERQLVERVDLAGRPDPDRQSRRAHRCRATPSPSTTRRQSPTRLRSTASSRSRTTVNTRLRVTNLQVMAGEMGMGTPGVLEVGTAAAPIAANVTAEIVIANSPLGGSVADPEQFGTGLMVFGRWSMHGSVKTPTFVRLATEPRAGNTTLTLSQAVVGLEGRRPARPAGHAAHQRERSRPAAAGSTPSTSGKSGRSQAISADGRTLTLNSALQYDHLGARDLNGVLDFLPHVGNLTRNVIVRSESATGTRGHTIATHMADVDIRYALFKDLGRTTYLPLNTTTNHIGRYPVHMHHLSGPLPTPANGYQFTLLGNAVDGGSVETKFKWGIAVHGSHYGLHPGQRRLQLQRRLDRDRGRVGKLQRVRPQLRAARHGRAERLGLRGAHGDGHRGRRLLVPRAEQLRQATTSRPTFRTRRRKPPMDLSIQFRYLGNIAVPNFKGAMDASQFTTRNGNNMPILQFENNEAYGAMQGGFTLWWVSSQDPQPDVERAGKRHQESEALEHLQQGRLHVSRARRSPSTG